MTSSFGVLAGSFSDCLAPDFADWALWALYGELVQQPTGKEYIQ